MKTGKCCWKYHYTGWYWALIGPIITYLKSLSMSALKIHVVIIHAVHLVLLPLWMFPSRWHLIPGTTSNSLCGCGGDALSPCAWIQLCCWCSWSWLWMQLTFEPPFPLLVPHMILSPENSVHLWICLVVPACISHYTGWKEARSQMRTSYCDVVGSVCICCVHLLGCSVVSDSLRPPWTIAHQAPLSMEFSRQETFVKWMNLFKSKTVIWTFIICI